MLAAIHERDLGDEDLPTEDCQDKGEWHLLIACLEDGVLWDNDFESDTTLDADPDISRGIPNERRSGRHGPV